MLFISEVLSLPLSPLFSPDLATLPLLCLPRLASPRTIWLLGVVFALQVGLGLALKLYFFRYS